MGEASEYDLMRKDIALAIIDQVDPDPVLLEMANKTLMELMQQPKPTGDREGA